MTRLIIALAALVLVGWLAMHLDASTRCGADTSCRIQEEAPQ